MTKVNSITWQVYRNGTNTIITNVRVTKSTGKVGTANFRCIYPFDKDDYIEISLKSNPTKVVFKGHIIKVTGKNSQYDHYCEDISGILKGIKLLSTTQSGFIAPIIIRPVSSTGHRYTINEIVNLIVGRGTGKCNQSSQVITVHPSGNIGSGTKIPDTDTNIPAMQFSHMSVGKALSKFLVDTLHLNVWYDYNRNGTVDVTYGKYRKPIILNIKEEYIMENSLHDSVDFPQTDGLYLINSGTDENFIQVQVGDVTSKHVVTYKTETDFNEKEMLQLANKIFNDRKVTRKKYRITFPPGSGLHFNPGDYFNGIGDSTLGDSNMDYKLDNGGDNKDVWQIYNIEFSDSGTVVFVGDTYKTIFDIYQDTLSEIDGIYTATNEVTNEQNATLPPSSDKQH